LFAEPKYGRPPKKKKGGGGSLRFLGSGKKGNKGPVRDFGEGGDPSMDTTPSETTYRLGENRKPYPGKIKPASQKMVLENLYQEDEAENRFP